MPLHDADRPPAFTASLRTCAPVRRFAVATTPLALTSSCLHAWHRRLDTQVVKNGLDGCLILLIWRLAVVAPNIVGNHRTDHLLTPIPV